MDKFPCGQEVMSGRGSESEQQNKERTQRTEVKIHGLSVERYQEIYNSVLQPAVLAQLKSCKNHSDYVSQVLELKRRLWVALRQPQLEETVMEDGRVEVKEIFDLT